METETTAWDDAGFFLHLIGQLWLGRAIWAAAHFSIPDRIGDDVARASEIAGSDLNPVAVERLLNALSSHGVFARTPEGFRNSCLSHRLRAGASGSERSLVLTALGTPLLDLWQRVDYSLTTGGPSTAPVLGKPLFDWFADEPAHGIIFSEAMSALTTIYEDSVIAAHDFGRFTHLVDIGGSHATFTRKLLALQPAARGTVFDLPEIATEAQSRWRQDQIGSRLSSDGGSFFDRVTADGDLYVLKSILHDWSDEECLVILRNIAKVIAANGRVAIVEYLLPADGTAHPGWMMDLNMLVTLTGRERRIDEYAELLQEAGFIVGDVTTTPTGVGVMEARLA